MRSPVTTSFRAGKCVLGCWGVTKEAFTEDGWFMTGDSAEAVQLPPAEVAASGGITEYYRILGRTRCGEGNGDSFANPTSGWIHAE